LEVIIKGLIVAGTKSGCGKTTVSLGLMAALAKRGLKVSPFKVGPDFIDPGHHSLITGRTSRNLDGWMLSKTYNLQCFQQNMGENDIAVVEGVMGLYDGYDGNSEAGSTAQMAKWLKIPVVLVLDAKSMARSAAAILIGFERFDPKLSFAGVIFNNVGSARHLQYLTDAVRTSVHMPVLGGLMQDDQIAIPSRHLGLVTREDHSLTAAAIEGLAYRIEQNIAVDLLLQLLPEKNQEIQKHRFLQIKRDKNPRIGVAKDKAFCFYYQDNLDLLQAAGAEISFFSPMRDRYLPDDIDGLYFGGGYPELYAAELTANTDLRDQVKAASVAGMPIYAECGGFMYLCEELVDHDGQRHPMTGCFPFATQMSSHLSALGYREITLTADTVIGKPGTIIRGHEFHYSELTQRSCETATVYRISDRLGLDRASEGFMVNQTLGSYNHLHFGSQPPAAVHFVETCLNYQKKGKNE
jgi:cobyrinic acid a,c-diamide synthase